MSVNLQEKVGRPALCALASGEVYYGTLEGVDGNFNTLLSSCMYESGEDAGTPHSLVTTGKKRMPEPRLAQHTLVRGENVVYIAFD